ncbi:MAG: GntR family transcriptional regulator [Deltaproteobacteria bacterium]|jgi:DNA-binding GntR family transcriptional regulator|nr:GntR family transcriptional regulator [Deltaproteobacteria bacterium]
MDAKGKIFSKQNRPTMTQIALENIREAIEKGALKPGMRIIESQLSNEMGMSRFSIREALCYLEKEGLIETIPFKGVTVAHITPRDIEDLMTVRCALEELAIVLAIQQMDSDKIKILESIMGRMENALDSNSEEDILNADLSFHQSICEFSENGRLLNAWMPLASQIRVCLKMEYPLFQTAREFIATHIPILEVMKAGDQQKAVQLVREHIYGSLNRIIPAQGITE